MQKNHAIHSLANPALAVDTILADLLQGETKPVPTSTKATSSSTYEGWANSATFSMNLQIRQEQVHYHALCQMLKESRLTALELKNYIETLPIRRRIEIDAWAEGQVNWQEIVDNFLMEMGEHLPICSLPPSEDIPTDGERMARDIRALLANAVIEDKLVSLPQQLARQDYLAVKRILEAMGGAYKVKRKGHLFESDPTDWIEQVVLTGRYTKPDNFGFFPTPEELARFVVNLAKLRPGMRVLEPSAGHGALAERIAEMVGTKNVTTIELQAQNANILRGKGFNPLVMDFLKYQPEQCFDAVVMNPPFSRQSDIDHVLHAWTMLKPGGRLVAIMAASIMFRNNKKTEDFRNLIRECGELQENEEGAFKESGTSVSTVTVFLDKPGGSA